MPVTGTPITCAQTTVTGQVVAGGQAVFSIPGTSLQLVLQGQVSITGTPNMLAFNKATGIGLQVQF